MVEGVVAPSGTVTFLFTDIEGSSRLWRDHPEEMARALERHDRIMRSAIDQHGGYVFTTAGDSFAAAFRSVGDAFDAAVSSQRLLHGEDWQEPVVVRVRMGLHAGEAQERDGDYFGTAVNAAARIMAAGHGGQILVSDVVQAVVGDAELLELGVAELRGIAPMRLWQVVESGLESAFPPLKAVMRRSHSLPRLGSATFGRVEELRRLEADVAANDIVTLTGVGGCGKTRLAIEAGRRWLDSERRPVWFVDLSAAGDDDGVWPAVSEAMLLDREGASDPRAAVLSAAAGRSMLLILDNCEHLLDPVAELVDEILDAAPGISLLATSREALAVDGERVVRVPSLDSGPDGAAVSLFVDRVRARGQIVEVSAEDRETIGRICAALDGLPLAIELAAGRADVMSVADIEAQLADRFALLSGRRRRGRARTLSATLDWSYDLLADGERRFFEQLSVFHGGFHSGAVVAVCDHDLAESVDLIQRLVDKSLLSSERHRSARRFRMLETVRQYAQSKLSDRGDMTSVRDRHLEWMGGLVRTHGRLLAEDRQFEAMALLDDDQQNLRAAMDWAATGGDAAAGLELFVRGEGWWRHTINIAEAFDRAVELHERAGGNVDPEMRTRALAVMAYHTTYLSDRAELGERFAAEARAVLGEVEDERERLALRILCTITRIAGPDASVGSELEEMLTEAHRLGTDDDLQLLHFLSIWNLDKNPDEALRLAIECQRESAARGNTVSVAHGHEVLANAYTVIGDLADARPHLRDALRGYVDTNHMGCGMHCLESVAWWSAAGGAPDRARRLLARTAGIRRAHKRRLHWLESHPHRAAIELCGAPDDLDPEDADLHHTVDLALELLDTPTEVAST